MVENTARTGEVAAMESDGSVARGERSGIGSDRSVGLAVVEELAESQGVSPTELDTPLWKVVDLEALEALFDGGSTDCRVVFTVDDSLVTVTEDGVRVQSTD
jgi:hypothetical protein